MHRHAIPYTLDPGSASAGETTFQIAWEMTYVGKPDRAIELMGELGRNPALSEMMRATARVRVAQFALGAGDPGRARAEAESVLARYGSREEEWAKRETGKCRALLEALDR